MHKYVKINYELRAEKLLLILVENFIKTQRKTFVKHTLLKMPSKKKAKLNKSLEINSICTDDEVQLLLESAKKF